MFLKSMDFFEDMIYKMKIDGFLNIDGFVNLKIVSKLIKKSKIDEFKLKRRR